jgi:hypothetical protein
MLNMLYIPPPALAYARRVSQAARVQDEEDPERGRVHPALHKLLHADDDQHFFDV